MRVVELTPNQITPDVKKIRLAAYCRVSTDKADQLNSFANQIKYYTDYTKKHPQYELVEIYADEGLTGTDMKKRAEFNRLLDDCKKRKLELQRLKKSFLNLSLIQIPKMQMTIIVNR